MENLLTIQSVVNLVDYYFFAQAKSRIVDDGLWTGHDYYNDDDMIGFN